MEDILETHMTLRGQISVLYNLIMSTKRTSMDSVKAKWEGEMSDISEAVWDRALCWVNGSSCCTRLNLIQFKVIHHVHYSKAKLAKIYSNDEDWPEEI